ncbi:MAG: filamentous hemagglutinin N-terminal domain-containing protein [Brasilonema angustatum HA4187-MV1]|jgi:filamentous hemagglutinin family protein|nr:filamentous hemagglutinin N-terminal domain-containing protein [Brasilonema angustatum HA4187-MV1]
MLSKLQVRHPFLFLALPLASIFSLTYFTLARAQQVTSDGTVSTTVTTPDGKNFNINDGTRRGGNLFHSFKEFSVPTGGSANFNNAADVRNIIGRVTGGSISSIDGLIRTLGKANLFLLNPAGIIFGPNAQLNMGGSFLGSTANSFVFDNGFEFSATNPQAPPLLTITAPVGLSYRENFKNITNQSRALDTSTNIFGLAVKQGNSLTLVGGDVSLDGGILFAPGGRVELGGLSAPGTVGLNADGSLSFPTGVQRGDVSLTNRGEVGVASGGGGSIAVNARNLKISGGSGLYAGIGQGLGTVGSQAGDITLDATGDIKVAGSYVFNNVRSQAVGNGANINITTGSFSLTDGAQLSASTLGQGNAGNVSVQASGAVDLAGSKTNIFSTVEPGGVGKGGNIDINAATLSLKDGAQLLASTYGQGNAGNVSVRASGAVDLAGSNTAILSAVEAGGVGKGGNIDLNAATLSLKDGAQLLTIVRQASSTQRAGRGDAGNVTVDVTGPVTIAGVGVKSGNPSAIFSRVNTGAVGNGGDIKISSGSFSLTDNAELNASTYGKGNAGNVSVRAFGSVELVDAGILSRVEAGGVGKGGNIEIKAASLSLKDSAQLLTSVRGASNTQLAGKGDAGNVTVDVTGPVTIAGVKDGIGSGISSQVNTGAMGNGGNIKISSGSFSLTDGAILQARTLGQGDGGNVSVQASGSVSLAGSNTYIKSTVEAGGVGKGGNITISSGSFSLTDGAQLNASTYGQGNAGNVSLQASGAVDLAGSNTAILSAVEPGGVGKGGNIDINAANFSLKDGAQLVTVVREKSDTQPAGRGDASNVTVDVTGSVTIAGVGVKSGNPSKIVSSVGTGAVGNGGDIKISSGSFSLTDGARLEASTYGQGNAGNVSVNVTGPVTIAGVDGGFSSGIQSYVNTGATGNGGNIAISSGSFSLTDGGRLNASTYGQGSAGNVSVRALGSVELVGSNTAIFSTVESGGVGKGGNIDIKGATFSLKDGAQLVTVVREKSDTQPAGRGDAGNVTVDVTEPITIAGVGVKSRNPSAIFSRVNTGATGNGGNITISSGSFSLTDGARLEASTYGQGNAGNITADVTGKVTIAGVGGRYFSGIFSFVDTGARGNGGNIAISSGSFSLSDDGRLSASTFGQGNAGNVSVRASGAVELAGTKTRIFSTVESTGKGNGGNININAPRVSLNNGAQITASSNGNGAAGDIEVLARSIRLDNGSIINADTAVGEQGNITLGARDYVLLRRGSKITTNATGKATGGNITINAGNLVAFPSENSDITANAGKGSGGQIRVTTRGSIFGIKYRPQVTPLSDITASSALGSQFSGNVQINVVDIDPTQGLFELTQTVVDPAQQVAQNPCIKGSGSSFTIVGRGGLPTDPNKILSSDNVRVDLIKPVASTVSSTSTTQKQPSKKPPVKQIVPAQGWIYNEKGEVVLVAYDPTKTGPQRQQPAPTSSCAAVK